MNVQLASDLAVTVYFGKSTDLQLISENHGVEVPFDELSDKCLSFTLKRDSLFL